MAFADMRLAELRDVCEKFGVEYEPGANKKDLLNLLEVDGVDFATWEKLYSPNPEAISNNKAKADDKTRVMAATQRFSGQTVLKMTRKNPTFEVNGKFFTRDHPFVAMTEQEAQEIIDLVDGFQVASPREVEEYYS